MSQLGINALAPLCRRLSTALSAGIDARTVLAREAERAPLRARSALSSISQAIAAGDSLGDAVARREDAFPALFRELVALGDKTGRLPEVFGRLSDHYEHQQRLRRQFLAGITWPMIQLVIALLVVGFLIWIMGVIGQMSGGKGYDILGWGLTGTAGLIKYAIIVAAIFAALYGLYRLLTSEAVWTGGLQRMLYRTPAVGSALSNLALARFTWALGMALESGMDVKHALGMGLRSTHSNIFTSQTSEAERKIDARQSIYDALGATGVLPAELLNSIEVAELSGALPESLLKLSEGYQDRARTALAVLAVIGGFIVWAVVALLIISIIFSVFSSWIGAINDAAKPI